MRIYWENILKRWRGCHQEQRRRLPSNKCQCFAQLSNDNIRLIELSTLFLLLRVHIYCIPPRLPTEKLNFSFDCSPGTNSQVLDSLVSNHLKTKVASGTYETSGVSFPSDGSTMAETFPTLDHDVGISITSADYYPAGPIDPTFDTFQHVPILQAIVPQKMCDCMPLELCVNQSTLNVITTRVVTRVSFY